MSIVVSYSPIYFTSQSNALYIPNLFLESISKICELFSQSCWGRWLTMSSSNHSIGSPLEAFILQIIINLLELRNYTFFDRLV